MYQELIIGEDTIQSLFGVIQRDSSKCVEKCIWAGQRNVMIAYTGRTMKCDD